MIEESIIKTLVEHSRYLAVNVQANSANMGYNLVTKYPSADYVCIDEREAQLAAGDKHTDIRKLLEERLVPALHCDRFFVTRGSTGSLCWGRETGSLHIPALEYEPVDTMGAGDAFLAVTSLLLAQGGNVEDVGFIGNIVGGIKTSLIGHRACIEKSEVKKSIASMLK
jgi:sugar/nucleoside kinase (ribokinase family)